MVYPISYLIILLIVIINVEKFILKKYMIVFATFYI